MYNNKKKYLNRIFLSKFFEKMQKLFPTFKYDISIGVVNSKMTCNETIWVNLNCSELWHSVILIKLDSEINNRLISHARCVVFSIHETVISVVFL